MALEREYSQLTVISPERRKLLGYLDVQQVLGQLNAPEAHAQNQGTRNQGQHNGGEGTQDRGKGEDELLVRDVYTRFDRRKSVGYTVITPDTSLDILEDFLKTQKFAIGTPRPVPHIPLSLSLSLAPCPGLGVLFCETPSRTYDTLPTRFHAANIFSHGRFKEICPWCSHPKRP